MAAMVDIVADLNKQLDEAHAENARLVLQVAETEAREERNIVDMQATIASLSKQASDTRAAFMKMRQFLDEVPTPQEDEYFGDKWAMRADHIAVHIGKLIADVIGIEPAREEAKPSTGAPFEKLPAPVVKTECVFPVCGPACRRPCPDPQTAPVVEEQGPWVIRTAQGRYESRNNWKLSRDPDGALQFATKEAAVQHIFNFRPDEWDAHQKPFMVMTVAEARAIEAKKTTGV